VTKLIFGIVSVLILFVGDRGGGPNQPYCGDGLQQEILVGVCMLVICYAATAYILLSSKGGSVQLTMGQSGFWCMCGALGFMLMYSYFHLSFLSIYVVAVINAILFVLLLFIRNVM
jgi:hypothetical protein